MLELNNTEVMGWEAAIRGMRNPMNSWDKSDSPYDRFLGDECMECGNNIGNNDLCNGCWVDEAYDNLPDCYPIGPNDLELMKKLRNAGTDHRKFMRMIMVSVDINAPLYWWKEFDTYKVGTVANSCSMMHKITEKEFTLEDFSHEHLMDGERFVVNDDKFDIDGDGASFTSYEFMELTCVMLNRSREEYLKTEDKNYWWQMIQLLPSSYNQRRTIMFNYEVLANMYKSRKNHKLDEWHRLCAWIETLPYSELITGDNKENIAYICDRKACPECNTDHMCNHTFDIKHAANFKEEVPGMFVEQESVNNETEKV